MVGNDIPEGQGAVIALLAECFELAYELRNDAEEKQEQEQEQEEEEAPVDAVNGAGSKD